MAAAKTIGTQQARKGNRTCVACGATDQKGSLARLVRDAEGRVSYDPTGRRAGRGAYVCDAACLAAARKTDKLSRALRCRVSAQDYERIAGELTGATAEREAE